MQIFRSALISLAFVSVFAGIPCLGFASDCWISPSGSGTKDGTSAENAYSASKGKKSKFAQKCWDETSLDGTMHVLEGEYTEDNGAFWQLNITAKNGGPESGSVKKKLSGEGKVFLRGPRPVPYEASKKERGGNWITIGRGVKNITVNNFHVSQVADAVTAAGGANRGLEFRDLHFEDTRQNFYIAGHPACTSRLTCPVKPQEVTREVLIQNTSGLRYSKRHVRLAKGVYEVRVMDSTADGGFLDGDFAVGFDVENPGHDIQFTRCSARRNGYTLSEYWNGDGFKSENETHHIVWNQCSAFDNADGGFDLKTDGAQLKNIIALRNGRNIRIWSGKTGVITNAVSAYAKHHGGMGTEAGLWTEGSVECRFCTLHDNPIQLHVENNGRQKPSAVLVDSIFSFSPAFKGEMIRQEEGAIVNMKQSEESRAVSAEGPELNAPSPEWEGSGNDFDSRLYGKTKGYLHERAV